MARNKYPQETITRILNTALQLFLQKGYEHTSIQDIVDGLGDLSKGAIYHHFKSKEDILLALTDRMYEDHDKAWMSVLRDESGKSGAEKLRELLRQSVGSPQQEEMFRSAPDMLKNPKMLALMLQGIMEESVPLYVQPVVEQGIADGSIQTAYPQELSETLLLLINLYLTPLVLHTDPAGALRRVQFFQELFRGIGLDILDQTTIDRFIQLCRLHKQNS